MWTTEYHSVPLKCQGDTRTPDISSIKLLALEIDHQKLLRHTLDMIPRRMNLLDISSTDIQNTSHMSYLIRRCAQNPQDDRQRVGL